ncbi:MAG TPA: hypothetical protein VII84_07865 [Acidimicrobiales bacterium]
MTQRTPRHAQPRQPVLQGGVEGNARLTSAIAVIIFVLLAVEGVTIVRIGNLLNPHVFIGVLLIPPVALKISSTAWRFYKYYTGSAEYRQKGPPPLLLRLLGPFVVVLTIVVFASGVGLVFLPVRYSSPLLLIHKASFVLWFGATAVHVLGHLTETAQLAPRDWLARSRRQVRGATPRQWVLVSSLVLGVLCALLLTPYAYGWWTRV